MAKTVSDHRGEVAALAVEAQDVTARLAGEFPDALRGGRLVAYFQPEVDLSSGRVVAAEALARWDHPELGTLSPDVFVPVAEQLGLTSELTCRPGSSPSRHGCR